MAQWLKDPVLSLLWLWSLLWWRVRFLAQELPHSVDGPKKKCPEPSKPSDLLTWRVHSWGKISGKVAQKRKGAGVPTASIFSPRCKRAGNAIFSSFVLIPYFPSPCNYGKCGFIHEGPPVGALISLGISLSPASHTSCFSWDLGFIGFPRLLPQIPRNACG